MQQHKLVIGLLNVFGFFSALIGIYLILLGLAGPKVTALQALIGGFYLSGGGLFMMIVAIIVSLLVRIRDEVTWSRFYLQKLNNEN